MLQKQKMNVMLQMFAIILFASTTTTTNAFTTIPSSKIKLSSLSKFGRIRPLYDVDDTIIDSSVSSPAVVDNVIDTTTTTTTPPPPTDVTIESLQSIQPEITTTTIPPPPPPPPPPEITIEALQAGQVELPPPNLPETNLATLSLVGGQEAYGLAIVSLIEAIYSFIQAPTLDHSKILIIPVLSTAILFGIAGPLISDASSMDDAKVGLFVATGVSLGLMISYVLRLVAPYSPSPKEAAFLGLLFAVAGFVSFGQNLVVDGLVVLPSLPSLPSFGLPSFSLPDIGLPSF